MMWWQGPGMTAWGYALTTVGMVLFWQLAVFGVIVLVRCLGRLDQSVAERPLAPPCVPSGSPAATSTSRSTDSVWARCEDRSQPAAVSQGRALRLVSPL